MTAWYKNLVANPDVLLAFTNLDRLRTVKSKYDPGNMFRYEQSIPPAT